MLVTGKKGGVKTLNSIFRLALLTPKKRTERWVPLSMLEFLLSRQPLHMAA